MTIFFSSSYRGLSKYERNYELILRTLQEFKSIKVISPLLKSSYQPLVEAVLHRDLSTKDRYEEYQAMRQAIRAADAVIFEVTQESFQIGYETTFALSEKKPVLCLSLEEDFSKRLQNDYFFGTRYSEQTLKPIIQDFLAEVRDRHLSKRFNLFLYPHQIAHLQQQGNKHGMNMSEYVRHLINQDKQAK
ncbi:MAG TPA: hypothetical protein VD999_01800 [Vitreimonas sp.]|nr:hypothetical protein [Vitreimonas sp.]